MNIQFRKMMSVLLCLAMLFGMLPVNAFATGDSMADSVPAAETIVEVPTESAPSDTVLTDIPSEDEIVEEPVIEEPVGEQSVEEESVEEEPVAEEPEVEEPAAEQPEVEQPVVFEPVVLGPAVDEPAAVQPMGSSPVAMEPVEDLPPVEIIGEEPTVAESFLEQISQQQAKADALAEKDRVTNDDCAEIYNDMMAINAEVEAAKAAGSITAEEYETIYNAIGSVIMVLYGYGYDPYAVETIADLTVAQGGSAEYRTSVGRNTTFTISPDTDDIQVSRTNNNAVRVKVDQDCEPGTYTISYRYDNRTYSFTVEVTGSTSGDDGENNDQIRVYVYVSSKNSSGDSWRNNVEFQELIGLTVCDGNGYFPAGEISLDADFLDGKRADVEGAGLIASDQDWRDLLAALGEMNTSTLVDGYNNAAPNPASFSENRGNAVYQYLTQAEGYTGNVYGWGSMHTALFRWHNQPYANDNERSLGFDDQSVKYHLDLCFNTNKITFITGNNGIRSGVAKDGTKVDERVYITGSEIQKPRNLQIPDGYEFMGYYKDADFTIPWDGIGTPLNKDETVYIKITEVDNVVINYVVAEGLGEVAPENEAFNPITGSPAGSTATPGADYTFAGWYADESCTTLVSNEAAFVPDRPDGGWDANKTYVYYAKFVPATADLTIKKTYAGLPEGTEPTVTIFVKDSEGNVVGTVNLSASNPSAVVSGLQIGESFTVEEDAESAAVNKYILTTTYSSADGRVTITGNADEITVSNTYTYAVVDISGTKIWEDNDNQDGIRPENIVINVLANGQLAATQKVTADENGNWNWTFKDLDKFAAGEEIKYTIEEIKVEGYETKITGNKAEGFIITNTHETEKTSVSVKKAWEDNNDQDGIRPESITVNLLGNGEVVESAELTGDSWSYTFEDLDVNANGEEITYTVEEIKVEGYETKITGNKAEGFIITNTHETEKTSVSVKKAWEDNNDQDGIRPGSIVVNLLADGSEVKEATVSGEGNEWSYTFTDLPKYKDGGNEIVYTVTEDPVDDYTTKIEGTVITNSYTPETTEVAVTKIWEDNSDQDGIRPDSIVVNLLADGSEVKEATVSGEGNEWSYTFTDLPKYKDGGNEIVYTVTEDPVDDYTTKIEGTVITNSYTPETTEVAVTKIWEDNSDQDGIRPGSIVVNLLADGSEVKEATVSGEGNEWSYTFTDLPKYKDGGNEIVYTVTEDPVDDYTTKIEGTVITNSYTPETTEVAVTKIWEDNSDQDGIRPDSIVVNLLADGSEVKEATVSGEGNEWSYTFTDLPKYKDGGNEIVYTVTEDPVDDYTTKIEGTVITNSYTPETTEVAVTKIWEDNSNQDGIRPDSIVVNLLADGSEVKEATVSGEGNEWSYTFTDLPKYKDGGNEIVYTITENPVDKYEITIDGFNVTNSYTPETTKVEGSKTWNDANNQDGKRPVSITINLKADGEVIETKTVGATDNWSWSFTNLPKYKDHGTEIVYAITENAVENYSTTYDGYNVINSYTPQQTSVTVSKAWDDGGDQDGIRPEIITIQLLADGKATGKTLELNADNNWTGSFTALDKFAGGKEIVYSVAEVKVEGYDTVITGSQTEGYTVTNTHTPATVEVSGKKTWSDNNNQDGKRPVSITIHLLADGQVIKTVTVTAADGWAWSFENLPENKDHGTKIVYTITEDAVDEYTTKISGYNVTNTHEIEKTEVDVEKVWEDNNDQDGVRPNDVTIRLLANGKATGKTLVLNAGNNWSGTFEDLDKYEAGEEIAYTVEELPVSGYTTKVTGDQDGGYTVTNTHKPATLDVSGKKTWNDADDQDGARPASITINLLANGEVIATKTVTAADGWTWSFTNLPKYENHGVEITYSITENAVEDYTTTYNGYNVTNTHTPEETSVTVTKSWKDNNDQDGIRPNDVTIKLLANGKATGKILVLNDANGWTGSFTGLDKFAEGEEITYTVEELTVEGYTSVITGSKAAGFTVTNTHEPETLNISGEKTWDDADDQDGKRPESITIRLLANGVEVDELSVTEADGWAWSFTDLPKYENHGKEITYTVTEDSVEGYTATYDGFDVTNKYTPEETSITVTKSWQDNNDQDGIRPEKITVNLLANGEKAASAELTAEGNWTYTFTELDVYEKGEKIVYTVEEEAVEGYETVITGDASKGFTVTNSHTPEVVEVSGKKTWDDDNNRDGKRPASITVRLLANGKEVVAATVTADDAWSFKFTDLPKFEAGEEIVYTVTEDAVEGYSVQYSDENFDITNKYTPGKTSVTVTKRWIDGSNHDGIRPSSVTIYLYANEVKVDELKLTAEGNWTGVFADLHVYENGKRIEYSISEKSVRGYNATFTGSAENGFTVTNTHNIIPKTGDDSNLPLHVSLFGASISALAVLIFLAKSKKKGRHAN